VALHNIVHPRAVTEFVYRYSTPEVAHVFISFQLDGKIPRSEEVGGLIAAAHDQDLHALDISNDEMSKSHGRYMIGGRRDVENERMFRFRERSCGAISSVPTDMTHHRVPRASRSAAKLLNRPQ
jgi:threonine dehydratase